MCGRMGWGEAVGGGVAGGTREEVEVGMRGGGGGRMGEEGREFCRVQRDGQPGGELGIAREEGGGKRRERSMWYFTTVCQKASGEPDALSSSEQGILIRSSVDKC